MSHLILNNTVCVGIYRIERVYRIKMVSGFIHYENKTIQIYIENFTTKNWKFFDKSSDIFHISAQNIVCGYSLEPTIYVFEQNWEK